jgi:hypothetical protein
MPSRERSLRPAGDVDGEGYSMIMIYIICL